MSLKWSGAGWISRGGVVSEMSTINPGFKIVKKKKKRMPVKGRLLKEEANINSRVSQVVQCLRIYLSVQEM